MPQNQAFDSGELRSLAIGYDKLSPELSPDVRLIAGSNMMMTNRGKLGKRPGTIAITGTAGVNRFYDHFTTYETLDSSPKRFIVASMWNGTAYQIVVFNGGVTTQPTWIRNVSLSTIPHEFTVSRGLCFIKGFGPAATVDPLASVIFNGSNNTVNFWGLLPPTEPAAVSLSAVASTFTFLVNSGWYYVYTWKSITGQESNRSPLQTDPSKTSSNTGPVSTNFCPQAIVQGHASTTQIPTIVIYRSTDGGGNFYKLEEITNTGAGNITYVDRNFNDGTATPSQPYPDLQLDTTKIAPSLVSNSPPPSVAASDVAIATLNGAINNSTTSVTINATFNGQAVTIRGAAVASAQVPFTIQIDQEQMNVTTTGATSWTVTRGVNGSVKKAHANTATVRYLPLTGTDSPVRCTPMATYASRIWYGIDNILFYSGNEEISQGVPEECFPSGFNGNFFRFNYPIVNVVATAEALYVICTEEVHWITGFTKDSFQVQQIFGDIGGRIGHPRAACVADKSILFLTSDLRICLARGMKRDFISDKLADDLRQSVEVNGCQIHLERHAYQEKDLLIVLAQKGTDSSLCRQWVYDFNQSDEGGLWNVPWDMAATCAGSVFMDVSGGGVVSRNLCFGGLSTPNVSANITYMDFTYTVPWDAVPFVGPTNNACSFTISLVRNPTGNHVNMLREPGMVSVLHAVKLDRTAFGSDTDPAMVYYLDNSTQSGGATAAAPEIPPRRIQSQGYDTLWYMVDQTCERVSVKFSKPALVERFECQMVAFVFNPDSGA